MSIDHLKKMLFCKWGTSLSIVKNGCWQEVNSALRLSLQMRQFPAWALTGRETLFYFMLFYKQSEFSTM